MHIAVYTFGPSCLWIADAQSWQQRAARLWCRSSCWSSCLVSGPGATFRPEPVPGWDCCWSLWTSPSSLPASGTQYHKYVHYGNTCCFRCWHAEPVRCCLYRGGGETGRCLEEMRNSTRLSSSWNTSDMSMESMKYCCHSAAHFEQKRSGCSAVSSPLR